MMTVILSIDDDNDDDDEYDEEDDDHDEKEDLSFCQLQLCSELSSLCN